MKRFTWQRWSVDTLIRIACGSTLLALLVMSFSVLSPTALPVMLAMSVGHGLGAFGFACYVLAVVTDAARRSVPPEEPGKTD